MRILIVTSGNHDSIAPFVTEQAEALRQQGNEVELFAVRGHGIVGYFRQLKPLTQAVGRFRPDLLHAHYGLCGLLCTLQSRVPVAVTYHGSDINDRTTLLFSRQSMRRAVGNIFVSPALRERAGRPARHAVVIPCGINLAQFPLVDRAEARQRLGLQPEGRYLLFAGAFHVEVKNAPLAQAVCRLLPDTTLLELHRRTRDEVVLLMNAADALLLTSHSEGSPQVVKEALACNLPVVSVAVGDVPQQLAATQGGTLAEADPQALADALRPLLDQPRRTKAREQMEPYDNRHIATRLIDFYNTLLHE